MGMIEDRWRFSRGRRKALAAFAGMFAASPLLKAQIDPHGLKMAFPIFTAPSSGQGQLHPDGEIGMYRGATAANTLASFASGTSVPHEKIAPAATGPRWQQFYPIPHLGAPPP